MMTGMTSHKHGRHKKTAGRSAIRSLLLSKICAVFLRVAVLLILCLFVFSAPGVARQAIESSSGPSAEEQSFPADFSDAPPPAASVSISGGQKEQIIEILIHRINASRMPDGIPASQLPEQFVPVQDNGVQKFTVSIAGQPSFLTNLKLVQGAEVNFEPDQNQKIIQLQFDTIAADQLPEEKTEEELVILIKANDPDIIPGERKLIIPLTLGPRPADLVLVDISVSRDDTDGLQAMGQRVDGTWILEKDDILDGIEMGWALQSVIDAPPAITLGEDFSIGLCIATGFRNKGRKYMRPWPKGIETGPELEFTSHVVAKTDFISAPFVDNGTETAAARTFAHVNLPLERGKEINPVARSEIRFRYDPERSMPPHLYHYEAEVDVSGEYKPPSEFHGKPLATWSGGQLDIETDTLARPAEEKENNEPPLIAGEARLLGQADMPPPLDPNNAVIVSISASIRFSNRQYKFIQREWKLTYRKPLVNDSTPDGEPAVNLPKPDYALGNGCGTAKVEGENLAPFGIPILKLFKIIGPDSSRKIVRDENEMGVTYSWGSEDSVLHTVSFSMNAPETITPDKQFTVTVETVEQRIYGMGQCERFPEESISDDRMYLSLAADAKGMGSGQNPALRARGKDLGYDCPGMSRRQQEKSPSSTKAGRMSLTFDFKPAGQEIIHGGRKYYYTVSRNVSGVIEIRSESGFGKEEFVYYFGKRTDGEGNLLPSTNVTDSLGNRLVMDYITIGGSAEGLAGLKLIYIPTLSEESVISPVPHQHPPGLTGTTEDDDPDNGEDDNIGGDDGRGDGTGNTGDAGDSVSGNTGTRPVDPDRLDPNNQDVVNHISQWISIASPPANAVPGSDWRYDKFGRTVGSGPGVRVISTHDSVDYGGATPESAAWSLRKELDSIDHCTLEEYVVAKLGQQSISQCAGRYGAVKKLKGVKLTEAKAAVTGKGFTPALAPGSPAKTPEQEGTVEKQEPGPEQYLKKGATVKLYVHAPYIPPGSILPDFKNKKLADAKKWLKKNDFKAGMKPGSPAPSAQLSGAVETQKPAAGTRLQAGEKVMLTVYSPFVDIRKVPSLVGEKLSRAKALLQKQGLGYSIKPGSPALTADRSGTIESQKPEQGAQVAAGARVSITVHSNYINTAQVPDVRGLVVGNARKKLMDTGLTVKLLPGPPAPSEEDSGRVVKQQPAAGVNAAQGSEVAITIYSPYVAERVKKTTGMPNLQCPPTVIMASRTCLNTQGRRTAPPSGSRVPLDRKDSRYERDATGRNVFICEYTLAPGYSERYVSLDWLDEQSEPEVIANYCREDYQSFDSFRWIYSATNRVSADASGDCFNLKQTSALARKMLRQVEPYALPCYGLAPAQKINVLNVMGLDVGSARKKLQNAGFKVKLLPGPPAPKQSDSGRVVEQQPAGGAHVASGSEVVIKIYSPYVEARREPDTLSVEMARIPYVYGKPLQEAEKIIRSAGFAVSHKVINNEPYCDDDAFTVLTVTPKIKARRGSTVELGIYGQFMPPAMFPDCPASIAGYPLVPYYSKKCISSMNCDYDTDSDYRNGGVHINVFWETSSPQKAGLIYCGEPELERQYNTMTIYSKNRKIGGSVRGWSLVDQNWARGLLQQWMRIAEPLAQPCTAP